MHTYFYYTLRRHCHSQPLQSHSHTVDYSITGTEQAKCCGWQHMMHAAGWPVGRILRWVVPSIGSGDSMI